MGGDGRHLADPLGERRQAERRGDRLRGGRHRVPGLLRRPEPPPLEPDIGLPRASLSPSGRAAHEARPPSKAAPRQDKPRRRPRSPPPRSPRPARAVPRRIGTLATTAAEAGRGDAVRGSGRSGRPRPGAAWPRRLPRARTSAQPTPGAFPGPAGAGRRLVPIRRPSSGSSIEQPALRAPAQHVARAAALAVAGVVCPALAPPARAGGYRAALCEPGLGRLSRRRGIRALLSSLPLRHLVRGRRRGLDGQPTTWRPHQGGCLGRLGDARPGRDRVLRAERQGGGQGARRRGPRAAGRRGARARGRSPRRGAPWSGSDGRETPATVLAARLRCGRPAGLRAGAGRPGPGQARRPGPATIGARPRLRLTGSLFASGSARGFETIAPTATDVGGGVRRLLLQVNDEPISSRTHLLPPHRPDRDPPRALPRRGGRRASRRPPPHRRFARGRTWSRLCVADYALTTVREPRLRAAPGQDRQPLPGRRGAEPEPTCRRACAATAAARRRRSPARRGGRGVAGARVCVATRVRSDRGRGAGRGGRR